MTDTTMESRSQTSPDPHPEQAILKRNWGWFLGLGIVWIVCGSLAIILPYAAAIAIEIVIGVLLAVGGVSQIVQSLRWSGWNGKLLHGLIGILSLVAGGLLLFFPLQGVMTLTLVLSAFFIIAGAFRIALALQNRDAGGWGWMLLSGLLGLAVGIIIWFAWPESAMWALGLLVGIELIFSGWAMVMLAIGARNAS